MQTAYSPSPQESPLDALKRELPNILILVGLLLLLLVVLTRFRWIHCSQVVKIGPINMPTNWCSFYCENLHGSKSTIAIVYGDDGIGDPQALYNRIKKERIYTEPVMIKLSDFSFGGLEHYDLVIFERARRLTTTQASAVAKYIASGGSLLWVGDAGTEYYAPQTDIAEALRKNETIPFYYEDFMRSINYTNTVGFGPLSPYLGVKYQGIANATSSTTLQKTDKNNLMVTGLYDEITFNQPGMTLASVTFNQAGSTMVSKVVIGNESYPAIVETRSPRLVSVYVAFPLEKSPSDSLIANLLDYMVLC